MMQTQSEYEAAVELVFRTAQRATAHTIVVSAQAADDLGAAGLQAVANRAGANVITERESKYHSNKLFRPELPA